MAATFDPDEVAHQLAQGLAQMREMLAPVDEAVLGYRRHLEEQGWSAAAAEQMALAYHGVLIEFVVRGKGS